MAEILRPSRQSDEVRFLEWLVEKQTKEEKRMEKTADEMFEELEYYPEQLCGTEMVIYKRANFPEASTSVIEAGEWSAKKYKVISGAWTTIPDPITRPEFEAAMKKCEEMNAKPEKLKRCPFCGCDMEIGTDFDGRFFPSGNHGVDCALRSFAMMTHYNSRGELAKVWNQREGDSSD